ncbi:alpha/beta-hydrolase [Lentithecium fluviatile CBS 122367]|uniref:Carboxylic ester hydrolase n=1 Tax=Lentithecium fluviatile CBS 122367 TaxID=1168545 RepID=A0A6G1JH14_9PLEO|nr:alpha/beta-hydrolase [Lentithecium fluviatile CBS 122367]
MLSLFVFLLALCVRHIAAVDLVVDLGYAKYRGSELGDGVSRWAGMRYARSASRVDGMRFVAPQDPLPVKGIVNATEFGPLCIGTGYTLEFEFGGHSSEDCLFANVFAPSNATRSSKLPVYVFIQGGGFVVNGNANMDGKGLIEAAKGHMVVVNFNYRVGPYGFLSSKEIAANSTLSLNNGLKDQRQLLKWVQDHIDQFGGDPGHVTIGGASAGAGSVVLQLTAYGGRNDSLFHAAAGESPAMPPLRTPEESQWQYDALLKQAGCKDLECLQTMDAVTFQNAVRTMKMPYPGGKSPPIFPWNPTLDHDFIKDYTYSEFKNNNYVKVPTIFGDTTNEGLGFTSKSVNSMQKAYAFIADQFPNMNTQDQKRVQSVWKGPPDAVRDPRWRNVAADIYGHIRYQCPALNISASYADNGTAPTWEYRWNVGQALHVAELDPIWNNGTSAPAVFIHAYWASFIRSYDPNAYTTGFLKDGVEMKSPEWKTFGIDGNGNRMLFDDNNAVKMEDVTDEEWDQCDIITGIGLQNKQ